MQITIREPGSAITHFIGMMMAVFATIPLLVKTAMEANTISLASMSVFMLSMILLYGASATYHSINVSQKIITIFRRIKRLSERRAFLSKGQGNGAEKLPFSFLRFLLPEAFSDKTSILCPFFSQQYIGLGIFKSAAAPPVLHPSCCRSPGRGGLSQPESG